MSNERVTIRCSQCSRTQMLLPGVATQRARQRTPCQYCGGAVVYPEQVTERAAATMTGTLLLTPCLACERATKQPAGESVRCPYCELVFVVGLDGRPAPWRPPAEEAAQDPRGLTGIDPTVARVLAARIARGEVATWELEDLLSALTIRSWTSWTVDRPHELFLPAPPPLAEPLLRYVVFGADRHRIATDIRGQPVELAFGVRRASVGGAAHVALGVLDRVAAPAMEVVYKSDGLPVGGGTALEEDPFDWMILHAHLRAVAGGTSFALRAFKLGVDKRLASLPPPSIASYGDAIDERRNAISAYIARLAVLGAGAWSPAARLASPRALGLRLRELVGAEADAFAARISPAFPPGIGFVQR